MPYGIPKFDSARTPVVQVLRFSFYRRLKFWPVRNLPPVTKPRRYFRVNFNDFHVSFGRGGVPRSTVIGSSPGSHIPGSASGPGPTDSRDARVPAWLAVGLPVVFKLSRLVHGHGHGHGHADDNLFKHDLKSIYHDCYHLLLAHQSSEVCWPSRLVSWSHS